MGMQLAVPSHNEGILDILSPMGDFKMYTYFLNVNYQS